MFTNILFLILTLLLITLTPEKITPWISSKWLAFATSIFLFLGLCCLIILQFFLLKGLWRKKPHVIHAVVCLELLFYLLIYQYILDAGRIFQTIPYLENQQNLNAIWELFLYFAGLGVFYSLAFVQRYTSLNLEKRYAYAIRQIRFLLPFALPFILLTFILDIFNFLAGTHPENIQMLEWTSFALSLILVGLLLIFLPYFIQKVWNCQPIPQGLLRNRLETTCQKAHFKHAGMKTWSVMQDQLTAGIIGIIPRFRYVMFTERTLKELPPEDVEAILVHEIGHHDRKHLLIYPFILAGMILFSGLFFSLIIEPLTNVLEQANALYPSMWWDLLNPLCIFTLYGLLIFGYFRFIFGYFSRQFERQADLHVFKLGIAPGHMIHALKEVAQTSGGYESPNWHHFSIKERVEFLEACAQNPLLVDKHHKKVRRLVWLYFVIFVFGSLYIFWHLA